MENKKAIKVSSQFYHFLLKLGVNRVKMDVDLQSKNLCDLPDLIVKYFKLNNDRYLELCKMGVENGAK